MFCQDMLDSSTDGLSLAFDALLGRKHAARKEKNNDFAPLQLRSTLRSQAFEAEGLGPCCLWYVVLDLDVRVNWSNQSRTSFSLILRNCTSFPCPVPGGC